MANFELSPGNDLALEFKLTELDLDPDSDTLGRVIPLETGTVTAFLATSNAATATAADASLEITPVHIGSGRWVAEWDAAVLSYALLNPLFAAQTPYAICQVTNGTRTYKALTYVAAREATAA